MTPPILQPRPLYRDYNSRSEWSEHISGTNVTKTHLPGVRKSSSSCSNRDMIGQTDLDRSRHSTATLTNHVRVGGASNGDRDNHIHNILCG